MFAFPQCFALTFGVGGIGGGGSGVAVVWAVVRGGNSKIVIFANSLKSISECSNLI